MVRFNGLIPKFNPTIQSPRAFINRKEGILTIVFDYHDIPDIPIIFPLLVRQFDKNGEYLQHFETKERFAGPKQYDQRTEMAAKLLHLQRLKEQANILMYQVNMRDSAYIEAIEIGWNPN